MNAHTDRKEQRRDEILDAAQQVFLDKGYTDTGIADIATSLGIGHGTFYRYFKNKREIALAVLDRVIERLAAAGLAEDPEASDSLAEYRAQVRRIVTRLVEVAEQHPRLLPFFERQGLVIDPERLRRFKDAFTAFTGRFLVNGVSKGFLPADLDIRPTAEALVALIFEGTTRVLASSDADLARRWMEAGIRLMFDGIARPPDDEAAAAPR